METVPLKLLRPDWTGEQVDAEQTYWQDGRKYHVLNISRIFYVHLFPAYEQVGAYYCRINVKLNLYMCIPLQCVCIIYSYTIM